MPELPEVETVKRGLERTIVGKRIAAVDVRVPKIFADDRSVIDEHMIDATVTGVERRAKLILIHLARGSSRAQSRDWTLAIHLKMTGQIIVTQSAKRKTQNDGTAYSTHSARSGQPTPSVGFVGGHPEKAYEQPLPHKHTHVTITFEDGTVLYFNDLRKFGWIRLFEQRKTQNEERKTQPKAQSQQTVEDFLEGLNHGPEPLSSELTLEYVRKILRARTTRIKPLLLDQSFIAGIGNIYADEALFAAAIKPTRRASSLTKAEIERLFLAIKQVLQLGIDYGGTSFNSYRNVEGTAGTMRDHLKVYGREDQLCRRCGELIVRRKIGQRSAHFCPNCQR